MKKIKLISTFGSFVVFLMIYGCSKKEEVTEPPVDENFTANFSNESYGCATFEITDSSGSLLSKTAEHSTTETGIFTTLDSTVTVKVKSSPYFGGIMFSIYDGSNNRLGGKESSGSTSASTTIKLPVGGIIKVSLFFYNPCPLPDEPGCPVPPQTPYSCK